ncbi:MAG: type II toxin-antitoxin system HicA family toxin [Leptolyngbyaceae cyanobacterium bins.302]|nr:type II toxin-antitoxin system HicA family toxin [Leptolyngbyaceae cyanobacterium bins.302]
MSKLRKLVEQFLTLPSEIRFEDVRTLLETFGFEEKRSKGSHHSFENALGQVLTIPKKGGKKVKRVYIKRIVDLLKLQEWQSQDDDESEHDQ